MIRLGAGFFSLGLGVLLGAPEARAEPPARAHLSGDARCPTLVAVRAELEALLPRTELRIEGPGDEGEKPPESAGEEPVESASKDPLEGGSERVVVEDHGASFSVSVRGETRRFDEPARDCGERARVLAVFVALRLDPPELDDPPVEEPEEPPPPRDVSPPRDDPLHLRSQLEAGPFLLVAPPEDTTAPAPLGGVALRYFYGARVGLSAGLAASLPGTLHYPSLDVRALWFPFDVGARVRLLTGVHELSVDVGVALTLFVVRGEELPDAEEHLRVELGGRVGLLYHYWLSPEWGLYVGAQALAFPRPYRFVVEPDSLVGRTPSVWLGGALGAAFRFD